MAGTADRPTVLVVEDEESLIELYLRWLDDDYEVLTAEGGAEALRVVDGAGGDVDVVLLDRLMPGMSGDEVLPELRDRVDDCKVAMVTAVEPDFDVLTMGFDDYLMKPIDRDELLRTIDRLLSRSAFAELEQELYALVSKQAAVRSAKPDEELREHGEFLELESRIADLRAELDAALPDMESDEFVAMVRDIEGDGSVDRSASPREDPSRDTDESTSRDSEEGTSNGADSGTDRTGDDAGPGTGPDGDGPDGDVHDGAGPDDDEPDGAGPDGDGSADDGHAGDGRDGGAG